MKDIEFQNKVNDIKGFSNFWVAAQKENDRDNMYCELLVSIRDSILLLAEVVRGRPTNTKGCTISDVLYDSKPDSYLAQDSKNRFKTMFFKKGQYDQGAIAIPHITMVGVIKKMERSAAQMYGKEGYYFNIFSVEKAYLKLEYKNKDIAQRDRAELLGMIEAYHTRGFYD
jgi:hypothetical protein